MTGAVQVTSVASALPRAHSTLPWYVAVAPLAFVLNAWIGAAVSPFAAVRALVVAPLIGSLLVLIVGFVWGRNWQLGALVVGIIGLALTGIHNDILGVAGRIGGWQAAVWVAALAGAAVLLTRIAWRAVRRPGGLERLTRTLNGFSVLLLVAVVLTAWRDGAIDVAVRELMWRAPEPVSQANGNSPNIYILLLDGYPRADTLAERYDFDNRPFLEELRDRGFDVAERSRTNYMFTQLVLLSMLHLEPVDAVALEGPLNSTAHVNRTIRLALNDAPALEMLRENGYVTVASSPGYESVVLRQADLFLDSGVVNESRATPDSTNTPHRPPRCRRAAVAT